MYKSNKSTNFKPICTPNNSANMRDAFNSLFYIGCSYNLNSSHSVTASGFLTNIRQCSRKWWSQENLLRQDLNPWPRDLVFCALLLEPTLEKSQFLAFVSLAFNHRFDCTCIMKMNIPSNILGPCISHIGPERICPLSVWVECPEGINVSLC